VTSPPMGTRYPQASSPPSRVSSTANGPINRDEKCKRLPTPSRSNSDHNNHNKDHNNNHNNNNNHSNHNLNNDHKND